MDKVAPEVNALLQILLPGFLASWVFHGLTSYPKSSEFERVIQALILTMFVMPMSFAVKAFALWVGQFVTLGNWQKESDLVAALGSALLLGVVISYLANSDKLHKLLRRYNITRETSFPSEWFAQFLEHQTYVVLQLKDDRRIYGWPREWPSDPKSGQFSLEEPSWIVDNQYQRIAGIDSILISVEEVMWVEFQEKYWEKENVEEGFKSTTTAGPADGSRDQ